MAARRPRSTSFGMEPDETKEPSLADAWADTLSAPSSPASLSSKIHASDAALETQSPSERADAWTTPPPPPPRLGREGAAAVTGAPAPPSAGSVAADAS